MTVDAPLRVALHAADPERRRSLARLLADGGHAIVSPAEDADVGLVDLRLAEPAPRAGGDRLVVLTDRPDADPALAGVLRRLAPERQVEAALRAVAAGLRVREGAPPRPAGFAGSGDDVALAPLTPREMEILAAIGEGLSNKAVARRLSISAHTVKFHLEAIFAKLDAGSRAEAVAKGLRRGLIEL
jgi:DNA-binding NarL/FixJ family response regulator